MFQIVSFQHLHLLSFDGLTHACTRDHVLHFHGIVSDRFRALLFVWLDKFGPHDRQLPSIPLLCEWYQWGDTVLTLLGNDGFNIIKEFEAVCIGSLINKVSRPSLNPADFLSAVMVTLKDKLSQFPRVFNWLSNLLERTQKEANTDVSVWTEIFGVYRHWGHPEVKGLDGLNAIKQIGQKYTFPNQSLLWEAHALFIETLFQNYLEKTWTVSSSQP